MKKKKSNKNSNFSKKGIIKDAGSVIEQKIDYTLENNYMPYAMSVIMSRALPEIDGFKPSHRKLLFTMYKMGLLTSARTKSANIVGQTMKLNPHGDSAIYDTMVRLSRGYEALLYPYVDSKGNFGKFYSRDMAWAASRYTEAKLDKICTELFSDIDKNTTDFVFNYDNTIKEPTLLPAKFPSVLVNANTGIAVGMASSICPFNLSEVCNTTIKFMENDSFDISKTLIAPDFPGGGNIIYDREQINKIYETGRGSIKVRARYYFDKKENCIDITNIPPTTTVEAIIEKVIEVIKQGKVKEISDIRDETGIDGLKITIDLKRNTNPDKLMLKLFKFTPLEDSFSCNFNILIKGVPQVLSIRQILNEWIEFRIDCVRRRTNFDLNKKREKLHLLLGLKSILLNIDKAIKIVRETREEALVVPSLMNGFGIDEVQAEYVAEIKLRHLNKEYILNRVSEVDKLTDEIAELKRISESDMLIRKIITKELKDIIKKYAKPRQSKLLYLDEIEVFSEESVESAKYPVNVFITKEGYLKKITPQSLRMSGEQKLKDNDFIDLSVETTNKANLLVFTNKAQVYKTKIGNFEDTKASLLGEYIPAKLEFEQDEKVVSTIVTDNYLGSIIFFFDNGKVAKVPLSAYETKTNRKKLSSAYCPSYNLVKAFKLVEDSSYVLFSQSGKAVILDTELVPLKQSKSNQGIQVFNLKKGVLISKVEKCMDDELLKHRPKRLPSSGFKNEAINKNGQIWLN